MFYVTNSQGELSQQYDAARIYKLYQIGNVLAANLSYINMIILSIRFDNTI